MPWAVGVKLSPVIGCAAPSGAALVLGDAAATGGRRRRRRRVRSHTMGRGADPDPGRACKGGASAP
ncbi:MAG: hypothetical protein ACHQC9_03190, partial [Alphaproteobacteria bacterium]